MDYPTFESELIERLEWISKDLSKISDCLCSCPDFPSKEYPMCRTCNFFDQCLRDHLNEYNIE